MKLSLYNTLAKKIETFKPISNELVKMYVCGPTVYDFPHIGNARSIVVYDLLFRLLRCIYGDDKVIYVRNITDVDDKIIDKAREEGASIDEITTKITRYFHDDTKFLCCLEPAVEPKATDHIMDMIGIIDKLLKNNSAYFAEGHVYFDISKAEEYTALSGRLLDEMIQEVRVNTSPGKRHPGDFVLWKPAKDGDPKTANFESPFGLGRPGWHIECSAMSAKYLGSDFDIHGGGVDLVFPHHTNEIAQSCSAFPGSKFARYWIHNGFLTVNKHKMSKSLGNFITVKELRDNGVNGNVLRLFLLSKQYRRPLDFNDKALENASKMFENWSKCSSVAEGESGNLPEEFLAALLDDLNISEAIKLLNLYSKKVNMYNDIKSANSLKTCLKFLGFSFERRDKFENEEIQRLVIKRAEAKKHKDWKSADDIRELLLTMGVALEDMPNGSTNWKKNSTFNPALKKTLDK